MALESLPKPRTRQEQGTPRPAPHVQIGQTCFPMATALKGHPP